MDNMTRSALLSLLVAREEAAFRRLAGNREYQALCEEQKKSEETVHALFERFTPSELDTIQNHYEGEGNKSTYEMEEAYFQGMCDCFSLFSFLSGREMRL